MIPRSTTATIVLGAVAITLIVCLTLFAIFKVEVPVWMTYTLNMIIGALISLFSSDRGAKLATNGGSNAGSTQAPSTKNTP